MAKLRGGKKLETQLAVLAKALNSKETLRVGFLEKAKYPDGTSVAMIAAIQDFGAPSVGIPPRPFFRNMIAANKGKWGSDLARILRANKYDIPRSLRLMGEHIRAQLQQSIRDTNSPPLAPSTLRRRGVAPGTKYDPRNPATFGAKPLIDTGHMLNSVDYEVK